MDTDNDLTVKILYHEDMKPDFFFIRNPIQNLKFEALDSSLQNYLGNPNAERFDAFFPEFQNTDVMACFFDDRYFRCKFTGEIEKNMPKVFLIDVGRIVNIPFDCCFGIPLRFTTPKACALLCHLDIVPKVSLYLLTQVN